MVTDQQRPGRRLLGTLPLTGDETVLDVGAGTGRDTVALLDRPAPRAGRVAARRPGPAVDYVRLRASARLPDQPVLP